MLRGCSWSTGCRARRTSVAYHGRTIGSRHGLLTPDGMRFDFVTLPRPEAPGGKEADKRRKWRTDENCYLPDWVGSCMLSGNVASNCRTSVKFAGLVRW